MMVMEKPIQLTMVSDVPFDAGCAFCATNVENNGESAITAIPHINIKAINEVVEPLNSNSGDMKQQIHDTDNAIIAVFFTPKRCDINPPKTQDSEPEAIIIKDSNGMLKPVPG